MIIWHGCCFVKSVYCNQRTVLCHFSQLVGAAQLIVSFVIQDLALPFQWCKDIPRQRHQICSIRLPGNIWKFPRVFINDGCIHYIIMLLSFLQVFLFANSKCKSYFHNRLKPAKLIWTTMYRKQHKKVHCSYSAYLLDENYRVKNSIPWRNGRPI